MPRGGKREGAGRPKSIVKRADELRHQYYKSEEIELGWHNGQIISRVASGEFARKLISELLERMMDDRGIPNEVVAAYEIVRDSSPLAVTIAMEWSPDMGAFTVYGGKISIPAHRHSRLSAIAEARRLKVGVE